MNKKSQEQRRSGINNLLQGAITSAKPAHPPSGGNRGGLASLVQGAVRPNSMVRLTLDQIDVKKQAREHFDAEALEELAFSLKTQGQQVPVIVRPKDDRFELVSGERRYRAAQLAGLTTLDAVVRELEDHEHHRVALLENMHRKDLNTVEETRGVLEYLQVRYGLGQDEAIVALRSIYNTSRSETPDYTETQLLILDDFRTIGRLTLESFVQHRLPLMAMPEVLIDLVAKGKLFERQARKLARVKDEAVLAALLIDLLEGGVPFEDIEERIRLHLNPPAVASAQDGPSADQLLKMVKKVFSTRKIGKLEPEKRKRLLELIEDAEELIALS